MWSGLIVTLAAALLLAVPAPLAAQSATNRCRPQRALEFLERSSFVHDRALDAHGNERALKFRVRHYGRVDGAPFAEENNRSAYSYAVNTHFFGRPIQVHRAIEPALECVERRIRSVCQAPDEQYRPKAVGGFRNTNTYRGGEVSNHLFGIAIDIDPDRNPCCGCVAPWPSHPACQGKVETVLDRSALPRCWVRAFERYGFYWLGNDPQLRDTMHFEFLGDPDRVIEP